MSKLTIKNIGPLKAVEFDVNRINVFMGLKSFVIANGWKSRAFSISKSWNTIGNQAYFLIHWWSIINWRGILIEMQVSNM